MNIYKTGIYSGFTLGHNFYNTTFYAADTMVYFEKFHVLEIILEVCKLLEVKKPCNVIQFMVDELLRLNNIYNRTTVVLLANDDIDQNLFLHTYSTVTGTPIIEYQYQTFTTDYAVAMKHLDQYLKHYNMQNKNLILFNYPSSRNEFLEMNNFRPTKILQISSPNDEYRIKCIENDPLHNFQDLRKYYDSLFGDVFTNQCDLNTDPELMKEFCIKLRNKISQIIPKNMSEKNTPWVRRVVIIGRRGSGRKVQAQLLSNEFGLIYIDVEKLIFKYVVMNECIRTSFLKYKQNSNPQLVAALLYRRTMKPDCIRKGWVAVGYPNTLFDLRCMTQFIVPPNKIVFLHCPETTCLQRIKKKLTRAQDQNQLCNPKYCPVYIKAELEYYNDNIKEMYSFCKSTFSTLVCNVDGDHRVETVSSQLWSKVSS